TEPRSLPLPVPTSSIATLSEQEMQRGLAHANPIAAIQRARVAWFEVHHIIYYRAIHGAKDFDQKSIAFPPDAPMTTRHFCLRIKARKVDLRKDVRQRIGAPDEITISLQKKRRVQFSRAGDHQFRSSAR